MGDKRTKRLADLAMQAHEASLSDDEHKRFIGNAYKAFGEAMMVYIASALEAKDQDEFVERIVGPTALCGRILGGVMGMVRKDGDKVGVALLVRTFAANAVDAAKEAAEEMKKADG